MRDYGGPLVKYPARTASTTALGLDETVWSHAGPRRGTEYVTGLK